MKPSISTLTALTVALFVGLLAAAPAFEQQAPQPAAASTAAPGNPATLDKASPKLMQGASTAPPANPGAVTQPPQEPVGIAVSDPGTPGHRKKKSSK